MSGQYLSPVFKTLANFRTPLTGGSFRAERNLRDRSLWKKDDDGKGETSLVK